MPWFELIWEWDEEDGNVAHIAEHGVSPEDVEEVFENPVRYEKSRSSGRPMVFGYTSDGRRIAVVYEELDATTLYPVTAYEVE
jgi:uncharacterized DUF497 family protein